MWLNINGVIMKTITPILAIAILVLMVVHMMWSSRFTIYAETIE
jgi:hypothetical protein